MDDRNDMDASRNQSRAPACRSRPGLGRPPTRGRQHDHADDDQHRLIRTMRDLCWGRIEHLLIRDGIPRLTQDTKVLRRVRPGRRDAPQLTGADQRTRRLHEQHAKLFTACQQVGDGTLERIEVANGLPIFWKTAKKT